ncbi:MAG: Flp pilus assembly complex ATPase component TadA, partial [Acidobacteria bacterium]|nr:Flp pilus assembly complex ATPase component TadA [Acidobacteriota bacterium]
MAPYEDELDSLVHELNRQAATPVSTADNPSSSSAASGRLEQPRLAEILRQAVANGASDILLVPGAGIAERIQGTIRMSGGDPLTDTDVRGMVMPLLNPADLKRLRDTLSADFAFQSRTGRRFRINVHHQRQTLAAAIRLLPRDVPRLADLDLPPALQQIATLRRGLVLVAGPTGAGKSSTLAALVEEMNRSRACHIVTVEDPVEFVHTNRMALVEQIEVGIDTPGFNDCLRSILRQSPDVILVGEMRDPETVMLALTAAETGHLVLS